ncbi:MAG: alpha/beta hydrolase [Anaerolineales bacterium]
MHFAHANGYPPECYAPLLDALAPHFALTALVQRPLWQTTRPQDLHDWLPLTADLLTFLDEQNLSGIIGVGHSMGGIATLRAAIQQPNRFRALILLDPVLFSPNFIRLWNVIRALGLGYRLHPLVPAAQKRRRTFDNLDKLFEGYRRKPVFRYFDDDALRAYVNGIAAPNGNGGYQLRYTPEWEARIYVTGVWRDLPLWNALPNLNIPTLILRGAETDTFLEATARRVQRVNPRIRILTLPNTTHLLPLEQPQTVAQHIREFVQEISL